MNKKLSLKKETVAKLSTDGLKAVHGGVNTVDTCVLQSQNCNASAGCTATGDKTQLLTTQVICFTIKEAEWDCGEPGATQKSCEFWPICIEI